MGVEHIRKGKIILCKAGNDYLPTRKKLYSKKLVDSDLCPICKKEGEDVMHVQWKCTATNDVWLESLIIIQKWCTDEDDLLDLWGKMMMKLSKVELEETTAVMRALWIRRNQLIF